MSTNPERLRYLLQQYAANNCTRKELLELLQAMEEAGHDEVLHNTLQSIWQNITQEDALPVIDREKIFSNIMAGAPVRLPTPRRFVWLKMAAAALVIISAGLAYMYINRKDQPRQKDIARNNVISSERAALINKPVLTLANGAEIVLDDAPNGVLALQDNATVTKLNSRQLEYKTGPATEDQSATVRYHTLTIPAGRKYEIILPDGSHVWLNASSSIRYPVAFAASERRVEMTGEAYFEVESLPPTPSGGGGVGKPPFIVKIITPSGERKGEVEVLGTHFNINAYDDAQTIKTTLVEGSVFFSATTGESRGETLKPGQQANLSKNGNIEVKRVNVQNAVAWKKGELILDDVTMEEAARIIGRWHNVHFEFKNPQLKSCRFTISFIKGETIQEMMDLISQFNGFEYQLSNNTVVLSGNGCL